MKSDDLISLWNEVDAIAALNRSARRARLDRVVETILLRPDATSNPEALYLTAYCRYLHPTRLDSLQGRVEFERSMNAVLDVEPRHVQAKLYLAFHYFDTGEWEQAKYWCDAVDVSELTADARIKIGELKLCLDLRNLGLEGTLDALGVFVAECLREDEFDIFPVHLMALLPKVALETGRCDVVERASRLVHDLVAHAHQENLFAKELAALEDVCKKFGVPST